MTNLKCPVCWCDMISKETSIDLNEEFHIINYTYCPECKEIRDSEGRLVFENSHHPDPPPNP